LAKRRDFDDGIEALGIVHSRPGVWVYYSAAEDHEKPESVRHVDGDDDDADDEQTNKAGFGSVAGGD
jgi:hypothetical protein